MSLGSNRELDVTREKLRGLEDLYAKTSAGASDNPYVKELTLRSLRRTMNQLKEEIARFESRAGSATPGQG
jgi:hypothetical protein